MEEDPNEAGDGEPLNSDVSSLPVEVTSQPPLEETSPPPAKVTSPFPGVVAFPPYTASGNTNSLLWGSCHTSWFSSGPTPTISLCF